MASLLHDLKARASGDDSARIGDLLDAVEEDVAELRQTPAASNPDTDDAEESRASGDVGASVPFDAGGLNTEALDLLEEDLLRDERARATGFVGKNSEVQWFRSIVQQLDRTDESARTIPQSTFAGTIPERRGSYSFESLGQVTSFTFYLDSDNVDLDFYIEAYELPPPETAERLLSCYMATVHDAFPILPRRAFESNIRKYLESLRNGRAPRLSAKWQAILNLVLAIGAKYSHLIKASWRGDERDHLIYQARARAFGLNEFALTNHPDVPQIQVVGLLAFYYLSVGQVSRSWIMNGMALRFAFALGLHVRNEDPSASPTKKEMLIRIWWTLHSLERTLGIITGRPSTIADGCCSVPLPTPLPEDRLSDNVEEMDRFRTVYVSTSSATSPTATTPSPLSASSMESARPEANSGSFFRAVVQMGLITGGIISSLYSAGTMVRPLGDIHQDIIHLNQRIDNWAASLPAEFNPQSRLFGLSGTRTYDRERMQLGLHFCSAKILLTRPSLGGLGLGIKDEGIPKTFVQRLAKTCIEAATWVAELLPDQPNSSYIYETGPWWSIVHHLMQALSVLLLAMTHSSSAAETRVTVSADVKKLIRWLGAMQGPLAERAYRTAFSTLEAVASRFSIDISDLLREHAGIIAASAASHGVPNSSFQGHLDPLLHGQFNPSSYSGSMSAMYEAEAEPSGYRTLESQTAAGDEYATQDGDPHFDHPYFHRTN